MNANYDIPEVIRQFLTYMETIKGKSKKTVSEYYFDLRTFFRFLLIRKGLAPADAPFSKIRIDAVDLELAGSVTLSDIYEFLFYITNERKNSPATRSRKISCIRAFYKYLCDKTGQIKENPAKNLETPKKKKALPKYLSLDESVHLLKNVGGDYAERDYCIMTLFLNCGLRLSELCGLNLADVGKDSLKVTGKGNKERVVYLNDACRQALDAYREVRPNDGVKDKNALFISRIGRRISPKTVQWIVKRDLEQSGLGGRGLSTHKLRHTAATLMYQYGGVDIRVLKDILGHENLGTTEIYTHLSDNQMKKASESNPLSKMSRKNNGKS